LTQCSESKVYSHLQPQLTNGAHWRADAPQIAADFAALPKVGGPGAEILQPFRRRAKMVKLENGATHETRGSPVNYRQGGVCAAAS